MATLIHHSIGLVGVLALFVTAAHASSQVFVNVTAPIANTLDRGVRCLGGRATGVDAGKSQKSNGYFCKLCRTGHRIYVIIETFADSSFDTPNAEARNKSYSEYAEQ